MMCLWIFYIYLRHHHHRDRSQFCLSTTQQQQQHTHTERTTTNIYNVISSHAHITHARSHDEHTPVVMITIQSWNVKKFFKNNYIERERERERLTDHIYILERSVVRIQRKTWSSNWSRSLESVDWVRKMRFFTMVMLNERDDRK